VGTPGRPDAASIKEKKVNMRTLMAIASVLAEFAFDALPLSPADAQDDPSNLAEVLEGLIRDATQDDPTSSAAPDQYSGDGTTVEPSPTNVEGTCENVGDHTNSYSEYIYPDVGHISEKVEHASASSKRTGTVTSKWTASTARTPKRRSGRSSEIRLGRTRTTASSGVHLDCPP
jgi:hypothetical protein